MNHFFHGNRPSRLLANKLKTDDQFTNIAIIVSETGSMISDPDLINQRFSNSYKELYTSDNISSTSEKDSYLQKLKLASLTKDEASMLGDSISLDELEQSLAKMNKGSVTFYVLINLVFSFLLCFQVSGHVFSPVT